MRSVKQIANFPVDTQGSQLKTNSSTTRFDSSENKPDVRGGDRRPVGA
jgi:hypothetical protein